MPYAAIVAIVAMFLGFLVWHQPVTYVPDYNVTTVAKTLVPLK
jgi:hypothetical protein